MVSKVLQELTSNVEALLSAKHEDAMVKMKEKLEKAMEIINNE
jgi:hypothetical protein